MLSEQIHSLDKKKHKNPNQKKLSFFFPRFLYHEMRKPDNNAADPAAVCVEKSSRLSQWYQRAKSLSQWLGYSSLPCAVAIALSPVPVQTETHFVLGSTHSNTMQKKRLDWIRKCYWLGFASHVGYLHLFSVFTWVNTPLEALARLHVWNHDFLHQYEENNSDLCHRN